MKATAGPSYIIAKFTLFYFYFYYYVKNNYLHNLLRNNASWNALYMWNVVCYL